MAGVPIMRLMTNNADGSKEQIFPQTHIDAVFGLAQALEDSVLNIGVTSINGQKGNVTLEVLSNDDYMKIMNLIHDYESGAIGGGSGNQVVGKTLTDDEYADFVKMLRDYKAGILGGSSGGDVPSGDLSDILLKIQDLTEALEQVKNTTNSNSTQIGSLNLTVNSLSSDNTTIKNRLSALESGSGSGSGLVTAEEYSKIQKMIADYDSGKFNSAITLERIGEV